MLLLHACPNHVQWEPCLNIWTFFSADPTNLTLATQRGAFSTLRVQSDLMAASYSMPAIVWLPP